MTTLHEFLREDSPKPIDLYVLKEKSRNMNLKFKSTEADLKFKTQLNKLDVMAGNILYMTNEIDHIKKVVIEIKNSLNLQKQVDDYFEEISPQTEQSNKNDID